MNNLPSKIEKYLRKHTAETGTLHSSERKTYEQVVVIPAIGELENVKKLLQSLAGQGDKEAVEKTLVLFVVNNLESSSSEIKEENRRTVETLKRIISKNCEDSFEESIVESKLNLCVIDCSAKGKELPEKEGGVGLARKIGMDAALTFFDYGSDKKRIIAALDADCLVDTGYFNAIIESFNNHNLSAGYVRFEHRFPEDEENLKAIINYEIFLRYYLLGLKFARSPYAIHTIGSTMVCDAESYVKIGGMNKRKAAEDFYFMEKLSKIVDVKEIPETVVYPSPRGSWRVPFGTGQRVNRFLSGERDEYLLYNPQSFAVLKKWLELFNGAGFETSEESILKEAEKISSTLADFLNENNFTHSWNSIKGNAKKTEQLNKQKKFWFDGFKTLKLIHRLRDNGYPQIFTFTALNELFDLMNLSFDAKYKRGSVPPVQIQKEYLSFLREIA